MHSGLSGGLCNLDTVEAHPFVGGSVASCILKPKVNKWTVFWNNSVNDIGIVIPTVFMATPVRPLHPLMLQILTWHYFLDIVHATSYSLLLLNTDLHIAELSTHMSKSQFVRNTMAAIQTQVEPNSATTISPTDFTRDDSSSVRVGSDETEMPTSKRSDSVASWNSLTREAAFFAAAAVNGNPSDPDQANAQEPRPHGRAWEAVMETLLKVLIIFPRFTLFLIGYFFKK